MTMIRDLTEDALKGCNGPEDENAGKAAFFAMEEDNMLAKIIGNINDSTLKALAESRRIELSADDGPISWMMNRIGRPEDYGLKSSNG